MSKSVSPTWKTPTPDDNPPPPPPPPPLSFPYSSDASSKPTRFKKRHNLYPALSPFLRMNTNPPCSSFPDGDSALSPSPPLFAFFPRVEMGKGKENFAGKETGLEKRGQGDGAWSGYKCRDPMQPISSIPQKKKQGKKDRQEEPPPFYLSRSHQGGIQ
ncbi:hypothetical protein IE53DRAFT_107840 [Violaceomyces palustris]|uniref:Uncharacterized protein n=1 Tax=Violaceomyces palustris TaxID=1673888 RepID=A0ACD0NWJ9_9BASI|nr:hypothetical protein IE53DRAFT_107840 [Violaceomyces palustris]